MLHDSVVANDFVNRSELDYFSAGSVLRMFQYTLGEDIFRAALKLYLETKLVETQSVSAQTFILFIFFIAITKPSILSP